jgi:HEAT repeat protein
MEALRAEIQSTRRLVTISMLQQQSPSQRLQGVSYSYDMQEPDPDVIQALVQTLDTDPNVNVRLAAADALGQFREQPAVRRNLMDSFQHQTSPLVQIALIDLLADVRDDAIVALLKRVAEDTKLHPDVRQRAQGGLNRQL